MLEPSLIGFLRSEAEAHGWGDEGYLRMLEMEASKARGDEDVDA